MLQMERSTVQIGYLWDLTPRMRNFWAFFYFCAFKALGQKSFVDAMQKWQRLRPQHCRKMRHDLPLALRVKNEK